MTFPSKRDWWLVAPIGIGSLVMLSQGVSILVWPTGEPQLLGYLLPILAVLIWWPFLSTSYTITDSHLELRCCFLCWRIPLADIEEVFPTRNPLSAPACSLDRLRINYRKNGKLVFALVSPKDKEGFVKALAEAVPKLKVSPEFSHLVPGEQR
ncbi:MAG: hypothetical protein KatS3mg105_2555 [Gemmatales bacterium]|nr:MAG: hypothetical protein KatS3mg105_2555 [Gemmatales bacterium]